MPPMGGGGVGRPWLLVSASHHTCAGADVPFKSPFHIKTTLYLNQDVILHQFGVSS